MTIQINSDKNITLSQGFIAKISENVTTAIGRFDEYITRLEVFLADENSDRQGSDDKRCTIEIRIKGRDPEAVTSTADDIGLAVKLATDKAVQLLRNRTDKLKDHG